jgi:glycine/D-amino acid oxidase-like deaminating enzyme
VTFASLWSATAPVAAVFPVLEGGHESRVLVIGGGFQGLSAALHLAESGVDVVLLEADAPGSGASGRNGGQVIPGLKDDPDTLDRLYGAEATEFVGGTADMLFALVDRLGIECEAERNGWIQAATRHRHIPVLQSRVEQWTARGAAVDWLDSKAMAEATGSSAFKGGLIDYRAGRIHPLKFADGLAQAARAAGAGIFGNSRVVALQRKSGRWQATTNSQATVMADQVLLATNAYTSAGLDANLPRCIVPANSFQIATAPLHPEQLARILPTGAVLSDCRRVGVYFRIGPQDRLMMGGRGTFSDPTGPKGFRWLETELLSIFGFTPTIDFRWFGRVAITPDHRIRLYEPAPGLFAATGFNGRGVALATALGKAYADYVTIGCPVPIPRTTRFDTLPLHRFHKLYGSLAIRYYRIRDALDH